MDWPNLLTLELIDRCLASEPAAWEEFFRRYNPLITKVITKTVRRITAPSASLVEDLVQDTYLKLCANDLHALREFKCMHEKAIYGYLKVVASNVVRDHFRKPLNKDQGVPLDPELFTDTSASRKLDRHVLWQQIMRRLETALDSDPDRDRDLAIFSYYYQMGLSAREISEMQDMALKAVENRLLRLARLLRGYLGPNQENTNCS